MKRTSYTTNPEHELLIQALCAAVKSTAPNMPAEEILAIASNFVGRLVAVQDQRKYTAEMAMDIVITNLQLGNSQMMQELLEPKGSA